MASEVFIVLGESDRNAARMAVGPPEQPYFFTVTITFIFG